MVYPRADPPKKRAKAPTFTNESLYTRIIIIIIMITIMIMIIKIGIYPVDTSSARGRRARATVPDTNLSLAAQNSSVCCSSSSSAENPEWLGMVFSSFFSFCSSRQLRARRLWMIHCAHLPLSFGLECFYELLELLHVLAVSEVSESSDDVSGRDGGHAFFLGELVADG